MFKTLKIAFTKLHGLGNDFIVAKDRDLPGDLHRLAFPHPRQAVRMMVTSATSVASERRERNGDEHGEHQSRMTLRPTDTPFLCRPGVAPS